MFKEILKRQQEKPRLYGQFILAATVALHVCILCSLLYGLPLITGTGGLTNFVKDCLKEITMGGDNTREAVIHMLILLNPVVAIISSAIIYWLHNYILATEVSRALLALMFCFMTAYHGPVLFASLLFFG